MLIILYSSYCLYFFSFIFISVHADPHSHSGGDGHSHESDEQTTPLRDNAELQRALREFDRWGVAKKVD